MKGALKLRFDRFSCQMFSTMTNVTRLQCCISNVKKKRNVKLILWLQLWVCLLLQDGWVGFNAVLLKKRLTAADFYNGYLHQRTESLFVSQKRIEAHPVRENSTL